MSKRDSLKPVMDFPPDFLWGAATSAHQVEGNNINSDWWEWEQKTLPPDKRSGLACDHYNLYQTDFDLAKEIGLNALRLSLEWSRIEPTDGNFNQKEIEHYQQVFSNLQSKKIKVMLTLHHYTNPLWFAKIGGWQNKKASWYFCRFIKKIVPYFKDLVDFWLTFNEPGIFASQAYRQGIRPPQKKNLLSFFLVYSQLVKTHCQVYHLIHEFIPQAQVGVAENITSYQPWHKNNPFEQTQAFYKDLTNNRFFYLLTGKTHDFLGVNYYFHQFLGQNSATTTQETSDLGWTIYPQGIYQVLKEFSAYHLPIYITENGLATDRDQQRAKYLISHLRSVYQAIQAGANVLGYFHWSLLDNFEWESGFDPKFGLIAVDPKTQKRTLKPSALIYQQIIKNHGIPSHLLKLIG